MSGLGAGGVSSRKSGGKRRPKKTKSPAESWERMWTNVRTGRLHVVQQRRLINKGRGNVRCAGCGGAVRPLTCHAAQPQPHPHPHPRRPPAWTLGSILAGHPTRAFLRCRQGLHIIASCPISFSHPAYHIPQQPPACGFTLTHHPHRYPSHSPPSPPSPPTRRWSPRCSS